MQGKYNSIDVFKLLMSFCVVAAHTEPLILCTNQLVIECYYSIIGLAVPFFFIAAGFLLGKKLKYPFEKNLIYNQGIVKKYLSKIIKMYLIWTLMYLPLAIIPFVTNHIRPIKAVMLYIRNFIFIGEQYNSWQLWYLLSTIYAVLLLLILLKFKISFNKIMAIGFLLFLLSVGVDFVSMYEGDASVFLLMLKKIIGWTIIRGRILIGGFYIPVGIYLSRKKIPILPTIITIICVFVLNTFESTAIAKSFFTAVYSIGLFVLVESIKLPNSVLYHHLRRMSTVIYFIHMYVWVFYYTLVYQEKKMGMEAFCVTLLFSIILSVVYSFLKDNYPRYFKREKAEQL